MKFLLDSRNFVFFIHQLFSEIFTFVTKFQRKNQNENLNKNLHPVKYKYLWNKLTCLLNDFFPPQPCILKARKITFAWNIYWGIFALEKFLRVCGQFGSICRSIWQMKNSNKAHEMYSRNNLPQPREETRNQFGKYLSALLEMHIKYACNSMTVKAHSEV